LATPFLLWAKLIGDIGYIVYEISFFFGGGINGLDIQVISGLAFFWHKAGYENHLVTA